MDLRSNPRTVTINRNPSTMKVLAKSSWLYKIFSKWWKYIMESDTTTNNSQPDSFAQSKRRYLVYHIQIQFTLVAPLDMHFIP